ncbi:hypothetical protein PYW07_005766 [Mythimna separata]|uniref:type I protein arginine methyltransferase n=1 Tax=Mythimna separata TaxID=271217 RepID=A0AAD7YKJ0_MYTSE|nr:hypothetical protein PYW07_005766 [Mythimna separata]
MELDSEQYFSSYEDLEVHKLMLEDGPRTLAYKNAILNNKAYFKDKVVMDVGCGTGILSIFCAQAGAKKVFAVEASNLANLAKEIVKENKFENIIEVIHSRVEDVVLPNYMKVDAIVSEWMGFYLLHEGMLDSVLFARDRFLKDGGEIFPESAAIYIAPCSVPSLYNNWDNLHGVSMSSFARELRASKGSKPEILTIKPEDLLGAEVALCWVNLREDEAHDLNAYSIEHVVGASKNGYYQGLCIWFECIFPKLPDAAGDGHTVLDTSPQSPATHWKQTVIVLPQQQEVEEGEPIAFQLDMTRADPTSRRYNLQMTMLDPEAVEHPLPCSCHMTKCILAKAFMMQHAEHAINQKNNENDTNVLQDEEINDDDDE